MQVADLIAQLSEERSKRALPAEPSAEQVAN